jgi:hypothetical protein
VGLTSKENVGGDGAVLLMIIMIITETYTKSVVLAFSSKEYYLLGYNAV